MKDERGFVYVATGKGYVAEAVHSAKQLKKIHPDIPICLVADKMQEDVSVFDDLILLEEGEATYTPIDKVHCVRCPYREAVFLDSDTWAANKIDELFGILTKFDLALLPENKRGWNYHLPGVPRPFAEFNTGVIVFRNEERIKGIFRVWEEEYKRLREEQNLKNDQPSFRYVLWNSDLRVAPIPSEYHFLGNALNYIMWEALLIHGRGDLGKIAETVNEKLGSRVYIPNVGTMTSFTGRWDWTKKFFNFILKGISIIWKKNIDTSKLTPKKWW